jgi:hypothetical protein
MQQLTADAENLLFSNVKNFPHAMKSILWLTRSAPDRYSPPSHKQQFYLITRNQHPNACRHPQDGPDQMIDSNKSHLRPPIPSSYLTLKTPQISKMIYSPCIPCFPEGRETKRMQILPNAGSEKNATTYFVLCRFVVDGRR